MRGIGGVGEDTSTRCHLMFICDQDTRTQFLSNPVPTSVLSNGHVTVCLFKNSVTHLCLARLTFCSISWCNYLHMLSNLPRWCPDGRQKKANPVLIKGTWSSQNTQFPGMWRIQYSVLLFLDAYWEPEEASQTPRGVWRCNLLVPRACSLRFSFHLPGEGGQCNFKTGIVIMAFWATVACWAC